MWEDFVDCGDGVREQKRRDREDGEEEEEEMGQTQMGFRVWSHGLRGLYREKMQGKVFVSLSERAFSTHSGVTIFYFWLV